MPRKCCVPGCRANYTSTLKILGAISAFHFPKREELKNKWLNAISRETWIPSKNSAVCRLHFCDEDVLNPRELDYQRFQLKEHAVPSVFGSFNDLVENTAINFKKKEESDFIENFSNLVNSYPRKLELASNWNCKFMDNMLHFFTLDILENDVNIKAQVSIFNNLDLNVFINSIRINVSDLDCFKSCTNTKLTKWTQLQFLLKILSEESQTKKLLYLEDAKILIEISV